MEGCAEEAFGDSGVVACGVDDGAVGVVVFHAVDDGVGELDFAACAFAEFAEVVEDVGA